MTAVTLFISSAILIVAFFVLKHIELSRGARFFEASRERIDIQVERSTFYAVNVLPKRVVYHLVEFATNLLQVTTLILLRGLRAVEHKLLGVSNAVKGKKEIHRRQASTTYLEDVTNYKKQIVKDRQNGELKS